MAKNWIVIITVAGLLLSACKNDKAGQETQAPAADTTAVQPAPDSAPKNALGALEAEDWRLIRFVEAGTALSLPDSAHITATFDGSQVKGSGGCNNYFSNYLKGDNFSLQVDSIRSSSKACPGLVGRERKFYSALMTAQNYAMPDSLTLEIKSENSMLTFRAFENGVLKYKSASKQ